MSEGWPEVRLSSEEEMNAARRWIIHNEHIVPYGSYVTMPDHVLRLEEPEYLQAVLEAIKHEPGEEVDLTREGFDATLPEEAYQWPAVLSTGTVTEPITVPMPPSTGYVAFLQPATIQNWRPSYEEPWIGCSPRDPVWKVLDGEVKDEWREQLLPSW